MPVYRFEEQLNDLMDYFILGDPDLLYQFKENKKLPDNLITEFTTQDTGDRAVEEGIMFPMAGIENHPYTVIFNISEDQIELSKSENRLIHEQNNYVLHVSNERIYLYTMPYLNNFNRETLSSLKNQRNAFVKLSNGWYSVDLYVGYIGEKFQNSDNHIQTFWEPTIEFSLNPTEKKPDYKGDINHLFSLNDEYS